MESKRLVLIIIFSISVLVSNTANSALIHYSSTGTANISQIGGSSSLAVSVNFTIDSNLPTDPNWSCQNDRCSFFGNSLRWDISIEGLPSISINEARSEVSITNNEANDIFTSVVPTAPIIITPGYELIGVGMRA